MSDWSGEITVGLGWVYYKGPVGDTAFHQHYTVQICFPTRSGPLVIETPESKKIVNDILVIGSNVSHRFSSPSAAATLLYIDPILLKQKTTKLEIDGVTTLDLPASQKEAISTFLDNSNLRSSDRGNRHAEEPDFGSALTELIWPEACNQPSFAPIDPRISAALSHIDAADDLNLRLGDVVGHSGLSASRFRHLFSAQVGMSLKSYLLWSKLQRAIQSLATDPSLTHAAHIAGFADSAHLSRTFRRTFGLTADDLNRNAHFTTRNPE